MELVDRELCLRRGWKNKGRRTQHSRHNSHARVLLMLVWPADAQVIDGVETERVQPGRDIALGSHGGRTADVTVLQQTSWNGRGCNAARDCVDSNEVGACDEKIRKSLEVWTSESAEVDDISTLLSLIPPILGRLPLLELRSFVYLRAFFIFVIFLLYLI